MVGIEGDGAVKLLQVARLHRRSDRIAVEALRALDRIGDATRGGKIGRALVRHFEAIV